MEKWRCPRANKALGNDRGKGGYSKFHSSERLFTVYIDLGTALDPCQGGSTFHAVLESQITYRRWSLRGPK